MTQPEFAPIFTAPFGEPDAEKALATAPLDAQTIYLHHCAGLTDLNQFLRFPHLRKLSVRNCQNLADVSALSALPLLESLDLSGAAVVDLTPLAELRNLRSLWLFSFLLPLSPEQLRPLTGLRQLFLAGSDFGGSLAFATGFQELRTLDLGWCRIENLAPLAAFPSLAYLELANATLPDGFTIPEMAQLRTLSLGGIRFPKALPSLRPLPALTILSVVDSPELSDVAALRDAAALELLILRNCPNLAGELPTGALGRLSHVFLSGTPAQLPTNQESLLSD